MKRKITLIHSFLIDDFMKICLKFDFNLYSELKNESINSFSMNAINANTAMYVSRYCDAIFKYVIVFFLELAIIIFLCVCKA